MKPQIVSFIPGIIWTMIIFVLLVMPGSDIPSNDFFELIYFDKWVHIGLFSILTILWIYPFLGSISRSAGVFVIISLSSITYGVVMEFIQKYFATNRSFDLTDILADSIGTCLGLVLIIKFSKQKEIEL
jgi:VanZ family protein